MSAKYDFVTGGDNWVGLCSPLAKNLSLFMTKICDIPCPIPDLTITSKPCFRPVLLLVP